MVVHIRIFKRYLKIFFIKFINGLIRSINWESEAIDTDKAKPLILKKFISIIAIKIFIIIVI